MRTILDYEIARLKNIIEANNTAIEVCSRACRINKEHQLIFENLAIRDILNDCRNAKENPKKLGRYDQLKPAVKKAIDYIRRYGNDSI